MLHIKATHSDAAKMCAEKNMQLATLDSEEKHTQLAKHLDSIGC